MTSDKGFLLDILNATNQVERYSIQGRETFAQSEMLQVWMIHHLRIIGEASRQLSDVFRAGHPEVPWRQIIAMRNLLVHRYFRVELDEVWSVVERDIPELRRQVEGFLTLPELQDLPAP